MKWETLKPHVYNLCIHELIAGNNVELAWTRKQSSILHGGKPQYHFDGPKSYQPIVKSGFAMLDKMNAAKMNIKLTEASDKFYLLKKGTPFIGDITVEDNKGNVGRVDPVGKGLLADNMGFIDMVPVALPASFSFALENEEYDKCQSILDTLASCHSLFGKFEYKPKYVIKLTSDNGENLSWPITTSQDEPLVTFMT